MLAAKHDPRRAAWKAWMAGSTRVRHLPIFAVLLFYGFVCEEVIEQNSACLEKSA